MGPSDPYDKRCRYGMKMARIIYPLAQIVVQKSRSLEYNTNRNLNNKGENQMSKVILVTGAS